MSIPVTRYVDITSGVGGASTIPQRSLVARIFTNSFLLPPKTFVSFSDAASVGTYFGTSSEEYLRALFYFSFISKNITVPQTIQFARWTVSAVAPSVQSASTTIPVPVATWAGITNGSLGITLGSLVGVFTDLDFTGAMSYAAIAAIIQTAIRAEYSVNETGSLTAGSANVSGLADTSTLTVGMNVSGVGIPAATTIATITDGTNIVLSNPAVGINQTGVLTSGDETVTGLSDTSSLVVGMKVTGTGIAAATTIATIVSPTSITLSADATSSGSQSLTFIAATTALEFFTTANAGFASATVTAVGTSFVFTGGVVGAGSLSIQAGATGTDLTGLTYLGWLPAAVYTVAGTYTTGAITSQGSAAETVTQALEASANVSNNFGSFLFLNNLNLSLADAVLAAAWNVTKNNSYMFCVPVTASNYAAWSADSGGLGTYAGTAVTLSGVSFNLTGVLASGSTQITGLGIVEDLSPGMPVSGTGVPAGTVIVSIGASPTNIVTMSNAATASGSQILTFTFSQFPEQVPTMVLAATDYSLANSAQNYMFQGPFQGLFPLVLNTVDADTYDNARVNYYGSTQEAGQVINFYQTGVLMGGATSPRDMTSYTNEMWLKDAITVQIMNLFIGSSQVPANSTGRSLILTSIQDPINTALLNGSISVNKILTTAQKQFISSVTNDPDAWFQVQNSGYWIDCEIVPPVSPAVNYSAAFTLVYSKDDVIRKVVGRDILI